MTYTITRDDGDKDARYLRDALDVLVQVGGGINEEARSRLYSLVESIEEQVEPAIEEPQEFGSVVRVRREGRDTHYLRSYSVPVDDPWCTGNSHWPWADVIANATDVEVLRVGIGGDPRPAQDDAYLCGRNDLLKDLSTRFRALHAEAITSERRAAFGAAIAIVEDLQP